MPGFVLARLSVLAPVILAAALFAIPAGEARAHDDNSATLHAEPYPLHEAAKDGDLDSVNHFLGSEHENSPDEREKIGSYYPTPLHYAARHNRPLIVEALIMAGGDVEKGTIYHRLRGETSDTPLRWAVLQAATLAAQVLLAHGADSNRNPSILHNAVIKSDTGMIAVLLAGNASINISWGGDTPLHNAITVTKQAIAVAKFLLSRGANPNLQNSLGEMPLHIAARKIDTAENAALVSLLLDKGANPNLKNNDGWRPLDLAFDDGGARDPRFARRMLMLALIEGGAQWTSECSGGAIPNENYRGEAQVAIYPQCRCPAHMSQRDGGGACECPAHSHSQVNGRCLPQGSAEVDAEIAKMQVELARLRAVLVSLNARLSLSAEMPREMVEDIAEQARETAAEIDWRRANFVALGRRAEAGEAPPPVALSDTAAECRMRGGEVRIDSGSGTRICLGLDQSGTFCLVDSGDAFPCRGLFKHVRVCNDIYHRPALNPFICAARCDADETARGKDCE